MNTIIAEWDISRVLSAVFKYDFESILCLSYVFQYLSKYIEDVFALSINKKDFNGIRCLTLATHRIQCKSFRYRVRSYENHLLIQGPAEKLESIQN